MALIAISGYSIFLDMEHLSIDDLEAEKAKTLLDLELQMALGEPHEKSSLVNEKPVISSDRFLTAILEARKNLNFTNTDTVDEGLIEEWVVSQLSNGKVQKPTDSGYFDLLRRFFEEVSIVAKKAKLPEKWETYIAYYIVNQRSPRAFAFGMPKDIETVSVNQSGELLIRLKPNLRYEDYIGAWKVFSKRLGQGKPLKKTRPQGERDDEILKNKDDLSQRQLARKYFPNQAEDDIEGTIKKIQQIIKRQRKRSLDG